MLNKIISGGQTGADQAVLDIAIKLGLLHGGWISKGRITEAGPLPGKYRLKEMPTDSYFESLKHKRQLLGIDLNQTIQFKAASLVNDWIQLRHIDVLYVIGPDASVDPGMWKHTANIVEGALILDLMNAPPDSHATDYTKEEYLDKPPILPKTVDEAVDKIIADMPLQDRMQLANIQKEELQSLNLTLGIFIRDQLLQKDVNKELFESCIAVSGNDNLNDINAALLIIEKLWEKLRETHRLRVIK